MCLAMSANGRRIAVSAGDGTISRFTLADTGPIGTVETIRGHEWSITALALDARGEQLATADSTKTVRIWNVVSNGLYPEPDALRYAGTLVQLLAFSADGVWLTAQNYDDELTAFDILGFMHQRQERPGRWRADLSRSAPAAQRRRPEHLRFN